jgi:hypothetical protein
MLLPSAIQIVPIHRTSKQPKPFSQSVRRSTEPYDHCASPAGSSCRVFSSSCRQFTRCWSGLFKLRIRQPARFLVQDDSGGAAGSMASAVAAVLRPASCCRGCRWRIRYPSSAAAPASAANATPCWSASSTALRKLSTGGGASPTTAHQLLSSASAAAGPSSSRASSARPICSWTLWSSSRLPRRHAWHSAASWSTPALWTSATTAELVLPAPKRRPGWTYDGRRRIIWTARQASAI